MTRLAPIVALFVAMPLALAGCIGGDDEGVAKASARRELKTSADISGSLGGIQGIVTDEAIQPLAGATVAIPDLGLTSAVAVDGSYAFSLLKPGLYTVVASVEQYHAETRSVQVKAEVVAAADFILTKVAEQVAYADLLEFVGFLECSVKVGTRDPVPTTFLGLAVCSVPQDALGENSTNDKFLFVWNVKPAIRTVVQEMDWEPTNPGANELKLLMEPDGLANDDPVTFAEVESTPPIRFRVDETRMVAVDANMTATCDGTRNIGELGNPDDYCRAPYATEGGPVMNRIFTGYRALNAPADFGFAFQQPYKVFAGAFYHEPAPDGFKFVP